MLICTVLALALIDPSHRLISDELGVEMALPAKTQVIERPSVSGNHFLLREGGDQPRWSLKIESIEAPAQGANATLGTLVAQRRGDRPDALQALDHSGDELEGRESAQGWFLNTLPDGRQAVLGWYVAPQALGRSLVCSAVTRPEHLDDVQGVLEQVFTSIQFRDDQGVTGPLLSELDRGQAVLDSMDRAVLESLVGRSEVLRVHAPTTGREIAYGTMAVSGAPRSAVKPAGQAAADRTDQEDGLLVTVHLRFAADPSSETYIDRLQRFWVSWDLARESWTDMTTTRAGDERSMQLELGLREAPTLSQPRGMLQVVRQDDAANSRDSWSFTTDRAWLPRGLTWFAAELLDERDERVGWWTWDTTSPVPRVTIRRDLINGPGRAITWQGFDGLPTVTRVDRDGRLNRSTRPDGTVVEVSDQATVEDAWRRAGLRLR